MPGFDGTTNLNPTTPVVTVSPGGIYTPTFTNVAGTSAHSSLGAWYIRFDTMVIVFGQLVVTLTASSLNEFYISTPVNSAFSSGNQAGGIATQAIRNLAGQIVSVASQSNKVKMQLQVGGTAGSPAVSYMFGYQIV